jgi:hypothetical protein
MAEVTRETYKDWVVTALTQLGPSAPRQVYAWVASNCPIPETDLNGTTPDGEPLFEKKVRFARWDLRREGTIDGSKRGTWALKTA